MFENTERTELSSLGEFGLIDHLAKHFEPKQKSSHLGIGDDAALIKLGTREWRFPRICWWKVFILILPTLLSNI